MKNTKRIQRKKSNKRKTIKKRTIKRRCRNYKKGGSGDKATKQPVTHSKSEVSEVPKEVDTSKVDLETRSLEELAKIKEERAMANNEMIEDASTVAKGLAVNTLETAGDLIGVDIDNPEAVNKKLEDIKETFTDPKNLETLTETVAEAAKKGAVVVEAAAPLIDPLAEKALDVGSKTAIKMADTGSTIFFNFLKEIPGVGLAYSIVQDASKIGEAGSAVVNATAELTTDTADSAVVFKKNLEELQNEAADTENRASKTIKEFENPLEKQVQVPSSAVAAPAAGGGRKKTTKKKNLKRKKTKRVRFAI